MSVEDWRITLLLADAAQVSDGKLNVLGGGWQFLGTPLSPFAVAIIVAVPWNETNRRHKIIMELRDSDGNQIKISPNSDGTDAQPLAMSAEFEIGRPPGVKPGTQFNIPLAFSVGPLPLRAGRYVWTCKLDDLSEREDWQLAFDVRSPIS